jgi:16S rRNA (cytosine967-C5)-methyltransferase
MTCTINPDENEKQVQAFLERHPEATLEKEWNTPDDSEYGEYFYVALLRKP